MKTRSMISFDWAMKRLLRQKANFEILEQYLRAIEYKLLIDSSIATALLDGRMEGEAICTHARRRRV